MNPTDPTKPPRSSLRAWLQHRTRTSWGTYFTHGPVLMFQLFLLHMQGLSDAQRLEDQRWCPNVPHLSQFLCNWETWRRYVSWVALRVAEVLVPSNLSKTGFIHWHKHLSKTGDLIFVACFATAPRPRCSPERRRPERHDALGRANAPPPWGALKNVWKNWRLSTEIHILIETKQVQPR
jgi:hypothetical protein